MADCIRRLSLAPALPLMVAALALAGCATPEQRVRAGLERAGVSPPLARCMAERMVDRLSLAQLRRIGQLGDMHGRDVRDLPVGELLARARALGDPEILGVMTTSAAVCALDL